ncbi:MAG TPA: L-rhamnose isomerase [Chloroflexi bacterium]|jgi:L-rhamnose isomerase/sugar isomerase|nr:L-rhamnose isomerase [Chloroflexota bacterium]
MAAWQKAYDVLVDDLTARGVDVQGVLDALKAQRIETPSWGYGDSGTRFKVFKQAGAARTVYEKLADAAQVHKYTGVAPSVALHIPWDKVDDYAALREYAESLGLTLGAINPNLFQDDEYKLGSLTHADAAVRRRAIDHMLECVEIARTVGSEVISLWLADGTNYPGQDNIRRRKHRLVESLTEVYAAMPAPMRLLVEYKFFEPAFYHTDLGDWGMALLTCQKLGERAQVLVDLGHHPLGTNIEQIVALLIDEGRLGGFHFNSKKFADDDLTVGSINPYELFLIFNELIDGERDPSVEMNVAYMIDQSHNIKPKIEATIQSVMNVQVAYAQALLIDRQALAEAQQAGDTVRAEQVLLDAYRTDVRPLLAAVREQMGLDPDPLAAYKASGYFEKVCAERQPEGGSASGYPGA